MPTSEEHAAHAAYMRAWLRKCFEDEIAAITKRLETVRHAYVKQDLEKQLAKQKRGLAELEARVA